MEISKNMSVINMYMKIKNVNKHLQYQIREYLGYYWKETSQRNQKEE